MGVEWALGEGVPANGKSDKESAQAYADANATVKEAVAAKQPSIMLFLSKEKTKAGKQEQESPQAKASEKVRKLLQEGELGDYKCAIAARFFSRVQIDVTSVKKDKSKLFCSEAAPVVVIVDSQGKVTEVLSGSTGCTSAKIYPAMTDVLAVGEFKSAKKLIDDLNAVLKDLCAAQTDIERIKSQIATRKGNSTDALDKAKAEAEEKIEKLLEKEKGLLAKSGLPAKEFPESL